MSVYGAIVPGATRRARLPAEASPEAKRRLKVIQWYYEHGERVWLTGRHFGYSPDTISRWVRAYQQREPALMAWNQVYETVRPHQALGYLTPERFYQKWLYDQPSRKLLPFR